MDLVEDLIKEKKGGSFIKSISILDGIHLEYNTSYEEYKKNKSDTKLLKEHMFEYFRSGNMIDKIFAEVSISLFKKFEHLQEVNIIFNGDFHSSLIVEREKAKKFIEMELDKVVYIKSIRNEFINLFKVL